MTERKFTDEEIIKALECCAKDEPPACAECPLCVTSTIPFSVTLVINALDLINRQNAEIERLQKHIQEGVDLAKEIPQMIILAQNEAIKEFAERLKEAPIKCAYPLLGLSTKEEITEHFNDIMLQVRDAIDNLANELTSEKCVNQTENHTEKCVTADYCIVCGKPVPEGRQICPMCEKRGELK